MDNEVIGKLRRELAEAIREASEECNPASSTLDVEHSLDSHAVSQPRQIMGDWYYVDDSLGNTYVVYFRNCCHTSKDYYKRVFANGLPVPPENHNYPSIQVDIDEETSDIYFQILRHSILCINVSQIKEKFLRIPKQEVLKMDNSNEAAIAARRRALAEALRTGEPVVVTATGEVEKQEDAQAQGMSGIQVPDGKLA